MWTYAQKTGALLRNGRARGTGYSGFDNGKNNPAMQGVPSVGPIPQGAWVIVGPPFDSPDHGPYALRLEPSVGTNLFGSSGFLIHGDSMEARGCASRTIRERVRQSGDTVLEAVAEFHTRDQDLPEAASA
jgi:hypothetical protein